jgi:hypothetical protein
MRGRRPGTPGAQSRKPLAAQFTWQGHTIFVINNHLTAKLQDGADFGRINAGFAGQASDHDPLLADITVPR